MRRFAIPALLGLGLFAIIAFAARQASYGWLVFVLLPVFAGFLSALACSRGRPAGLGECLGMSLYPLALGGVLLLLRGVEGIICLAMAAPLTIPLALLGGYLAYKSQVYDSAPTVGSCLILLLPAGIFFGPHGPGHQIFVVTTSMVVNAPPEVVWNRVTAFPDLPEPEGVLFRAGVAYPVGTRIQGERVGATRQCILSTGVLAEKVTVWDSPRLLRFRVTSTPPAMKELGLWGSFDTPHLHDYYVSKQGQFSLTALPGNRTLVEGTSWYQHGLEPAQYWRLWSDHVVHQVHRRVLLHVKRLAEEDWLGTEFRARFVAGVRPG